MIKNSVFLKSLLIGFVILLIPKFLPAQSGGINCFVYHRVGDDRYPSTNIKKVVFEAHLLYFKEHGFHVISFGEAVSLLKSGNEIPGKTVVITFDDGYLSMYENGLPLLKKYGFPATVFISTKQVGYGGQVTWKQLKEMQQVGIEIGMHSHSHAYFLDLPPEKRLTAFDEDLETCISAFQNNLDTVPQIYAYPFGEYSGAMFDILKKHGVLAAAAQHSGVISNQAELYALPRFPMNEQFGVWKEFKQKASMQPLPIIKVTAISPLVADGQIPALQLTVDTSLVDPQKINCFWYGKRSCQVEVLDKSKGEISVSTSGHLQGRRGKYTLTAPLKSGNWAWYSHPWFRAEQ